MYAEYAVTMNACHKTYLGLSACPHCAVPIASGTVNGYAAPASPSERSTVAFHYDRSMYLVSHIGLL